MTFLLYHNMNRPTGNSSQRNAVLASGNDAAAARAVANAAAPDGETKAHDDWDVILLSSEDTLPNPIWFRGMVDAPIQHTRGG
jgi:hypothetical protein